MQICNLNGTWRMKRTNQVDWINATVPGSVYNDLLNAFVIEDPYYRDNEYEATELSNYDYEYRRNFTVTPDMLQYRQICLLCEGLDTICEVFLNEKSVLSACNMHRTYEVDIKEFLIEGENSIHVIFRSPVEYVKRKHKEMELPNSSDAIEGISHLRKAHCMFGWDWGPKLPDMGIWRNISIHGYDAVRLEDVYVTQFHQDDCVNLDVRVRVKGSAVGSFEPGVLIRLEVVTPENETISVSQTVLEPEVHIKVVIQNPKLWWPNNYGDQPLYTIHVELIKGQSKLEEQNSRIGLRTLTVKQEMDQWGKSFEFQVNGISIFSMGGDYIPEDNILARCNKERTRQLIRDCVDANFNSIRVWGGAYYPEDYFYDLCDEYGLIVWQDLMYACGVYALTKEFKENIYEETVDNMKRLRHHACLGLWCGNNEQEWGWVDWGWSQSCSPVLKTDYIKMYEVMLPQIASEVDPNTFYWLASPSSGGSFDKPNDEKYGDMHFWGVWHEKLPFTAYRKIFPRFMSEFGIQSFPGLKTIESFTEASDRNIFSYVMESHQKNGSGNEKIMYYISDNYKYPKDFDSLLFASQLIQAEGLRYGVEHWRRNRGRCMGAIYWQINDCWPVASWASRDYYGRWKALHYAAKKFFAPVLASANDEGTKVSLHVSNESLQAVTGTLTWRLMDATSRVLSSEEKTITVEAASSSKVYDLDFASVLSSKELLRSTYLEYSLTGDDFEESRGTVLFVKSKHFEFLDPQITALVCESDDRFILELSSKAYTRFVELDLKSADAVFSDNYFDLSAGDIRRIELLKERLSKPMSREEVEKELTVRSIYHTF